MLIRTDGERVVAIAQPAHAGLSGQLARAWGNARFGTVAPVDDVYLGAALHDIGWIDWEQEPTVNEATGLPHSFLQLPTRVHLTIWEGASRRALAYGRYAALLTSMHFTGLYEQFHDYSRDSEEDARDARALVAREIAFQREMIAALRSDPRTAAWADDDVVPRNRRLVALWDGMSLAICHGLREPRTFRAVPDAEGEVNLTLTPGDTTVVVDPWPFRVDRLSVGVDGRVLEGSYGDQQALRDALATARWVRIDTVLLPPG